MARIGTKGKRKLLGCALLLPVLALALHTAWLVRTGHEHTDRLLPLLTRLEAEGLRPSDLPSGWLEALLAVEDPAFHDHNGVDLSTPGAGMTTLTQGLVKIHFFEDFQPGLAKFKQTVWAMVLDRRLSKERQLVLVLNTANLGSADGEPVRGFAEAARAYHQRPFDQLTEGEYLSLVAMLVGPNTFHVRDRPAKNAERVARIEALLAGECAPAGLRDVYLAGC